MKKVVSLFFVFFAFMLASNATNKPQQNGAKANTTEAEAVNKKHTIYITKADFVKKVSDLDKDPISWKYLGDKPCIIDFYTTWCGPCRTLAPILEELAKEYEGKIYIYKADAEKEVELARAFKVQAYPTLIFCPMQGNPQMAKGALPKGQIVDIINQVLLKKQAPPPPAFLQRR